MASKRDYYEVLGVDKSASQDEIKKAFRKAAKENHPDLHPGDKDAEARFKEIQEAYEILSDEQNRAKYDQFGHAAFDPSFGAGAGGSGFGGFGGFGDINVDLGDIFDSFFGGGRTRSSPNAPRKGRNISTSLSITFEEAAFGCTKELSIGRIEPCADCHGTGCTPGTTPEVCSDCHGTGTVRTQTRTAFGVMSSTTTCSRCVGTGKIIHSPCTTCRGKGSVRRNRKISVNIPAGVDDGMTVSVHGQGNQGVNGGPNGDLLVTITVLNHSQFQRDGTSVLYRLPISITQAALGAELQVPTLDGSVMLKIPEGTQSEAVFRLRGKGIPSLNGGSRGDQFVTVSVQTPKGLSSEQKDLLRQLAETFGEGGGSGGKKKRRK
ncbi:MAG: molecular chaperone DnaJ [Oscillospiraceae bacterium]|nr:molecular chaperone DnaJ [Oscillospiraceae bacterium]